MQGRISSLLLFLFLVFLVLPAHLYLANSSLKILRFVPVFEPKNWMDALNYCKENYSDLATFATELESSMLDMYEGWIGLYKTPNNEWKWSTDPDELGKVQLCVFKNRTNLEIDKCHHNHPFLCMDKRLILVQEEKTWEEALQYCRELHAAEWPNTTPMYDLASLPHAINILMTADATELNTPTKEVWVGLRFLADEWKWLSGQAVTSSHLPPCPAQDQLCGALDRNTSQWKIINCSERRNFICMINCERCEKNPLQMLTS